MTAKKVESTLPHTVWVGIDTLDAGSAVFSGFKGPRLIISRTLWQDLGEPHALNLTLAAYEKGSQ